MTSPIPGGTTEKKTRNTFGLETDAALAKFTPASAELMETVSIQRRNAIAMLLHHFN
jgi:hypothetical protein